MNGNHNITMMMLGPRAVGKTTLMALMYKGLVGVNLQSNFDFSAEHDTAIDLDEAYLKLTDILSQPTFTRIEPLLRGSEGVLERRFSVNFHRRKEFDFIFYDHAGVLLHQKESVPGVQEFKEKLQRAIIIINLVDGAAIMEGSRLFSDRVNRPFLVSELLRKAFDDEQEHLLLFVITKCEAWLKDREGRQALEKAFETYHKEVLNVVENRPQNNVVAVLMPVKTLGCVEFSEVRHYGEPDEEIVFIRKPNVPFHPEGIEQPLRYALAFALSQHDKNRGPVTKFFKWLTGESVVFENALAQFANQRDRSFKMYGNTSLIV